MPRPSAFDALQPEEIERINQELIRRNFKGYDDLAEWVKTMGFEISRPALHRHGQKVKRRLEAVRASTEAARMIAEAAPDDADLRSSAVMALVQSELFDVMVGLQEMEDAKETGERVYLLNQAALAASRLSRSTVNQRKWQAEVRAKLQAAAKDAEPIAKKAGLSDDDWAAIRAKFLGVEVEA